MKTTEEFSRPYREPVAIDVSPVPRREHLSGAVAVARKQHQDGLAEIDGQIAQCQKEVAECEEQLAQPGISDAVKKSVNYRMAKAKARIASMRRSRQAKVDTFERERKQFRGSEVPEWVGRTL